MKKTHPTQNILDQFATGELSDKQAIVVSAHASNCKTCKEYLTQRESLLSEVYFSPEPTSTSHLTVDLSDIEQAILKSTPTNDSISAKKVEPLIIKNKFIELPTQLNRLKAQMQPWRNIGNKISYSKIDVHGPGNLYFIHFEKGAKIPEHTHEGDEFSYIVAGTFCDQSCEYVTGDFASFDSDDTHHPYTNDPDGCLLLVSIDAPFIFKEGLARLLNPFRKWLT